MLDFVCSSFKEVQIQKNVKLLYLPVANLCPITYIQKHRHK